MHINATVSCTELGAGVGGSDVRWLEEVSSKMENGEWRMEMNRSNSSSVEATEGLGVDSR